MAETNIARRNTTDGITRVLFNSQGHPTDNWKYRRLINRGNQFKGNTMTPIPAIGSLNTSYVLLQQRNIIINTDHINAVRLTDVLLQDP